MVDYSNALKRKLLLPPYGNARLTEAAIALLIPDTITTERRAGALSPAEIAMPDETPLHAQVQSHGRRLDVHARRLEELEVWRAAHQAHSQATEAEMRASNARVESVVTVHNGKLDALASQQSRLVAYASIGAALAAAVVSWGLSKL